VITSGGKPRFKRYLDEQKGSALQSVWVDVPGVNSQAIERIGYPTQKPEALLERIIQASSNPGDVVADFFVGGGTTAAVAQRLGRRWIACDQSRVAVAVTADRLAKQAEQANMQNITGGASRTSPSSIGAPTRQRVCPRPRRTSSGASS